MQKYEVWMIAITSVPNNSHCTDRTEEWKLKLDGTFDSEQEAKDYVKQQTRCHPSTFGEVAKWLIQYDTEEEKQAFLDEFCFDETKTQYAFKRRFFVGRPPKGTIKNMVIQEGLIYIGSD